MRYGYDSFTDTEVEEEDPEPPELKKRLKLQRMNAVSKWAPPIPPDESLTRSKAAPPVKSKNIDVESSRTAPTTTSDENLNTKRPETHLNRPGENSCLGSSIEDESETSFLHDSPVDRLSLSTSVITADGILEDTCHCKHQVHWTKEILRILLRLENRQNRSQCSCSLEGDDFEKLEPIDFPTSTDGIIKFFAELEDDDKRSVVVKRLGKEVSKHKKLSIQKIILRIAPPKAWSGFSKNGQRGKHSAINIGLPSLIKDCLEICKVSTVYMLKVE